MNYFNSVWLLNILHIFYVLFFPFMDFWLETYLPIRHTLGRTPEVPFWG